MRQPTNTLTQDVERVVRQRSLPGLGRDSEWLLSRHAHVPTRVRVLRRKRARAIEVALRAGMPGGQS